MAIVDQVIEVQQRALLLSRFRSVAFAALGADVTEAELREALATAVDAHSKREAPPRPLLRAVPAT
jgi:hypothetical protein